MSKMEFTITNAILKNAINRVSALVDKKASIPAFQGVLIKAAERKKRMRIMCIQKFSGLTLVIGSVIAGAIIGNITFGILTIPVGLLMLFLREPCLVIKNKKKCDTESVRA